MTKVYEAKVNDEYTARVSEEGNKTITIEVLAMNGHSLYAVTGVSEQAGLAIGKALADWEHHNPTRKIKTV